LSQTDRQEVSIRKIDCHFGLRKVLNGAEKKGVEAKEKGRKKKDKMKSKEERKNRRNEMENGHL
jgi:hypothetical protein